MKIYLELFILAILLLIPVCWKLWFDWSKKRLLKKYDPNNDKGRKGDFHSGTSTKERESGSTVVNPYGFEQLERREFFQETGPSSVRKNSFGLGIFNRFRK